MKTRFTLTQTRQWASIAIGVIATATTAAAFVNSYRGLYDWAIGHGHVPPHLAWMWPVLLDGFVATGELRLLIAVIDGSPLWSRAQLWGWSLTLSGLAASVAGNIGHAPGWEVQVTYAVAPLAAAAGLGTALGLVKSAARKPRTVTRDRARELHPSARDSQPAQPGQPAGDKLEQVRALVRANPKVSTNEVRLAVHVRQPEAKTLREMALAELNGAGHGPA